MLQENEVTVVQAGKPSKRKAICVNREASLDTLIACESMTASSTAQG
jgi:hypothetical protein